MLENWRNGNAVMAQQQSKINTWHKGQTKPQPIKSKQALTYGGRSTRIYHLEIPQEEKMLDSGVAVKLDGRTFARTTRETSKSYKI